MKHGFAVVMAILACCAIPLKTAGAQVGSNGTQAPYGGSVLSLSEVLSRVLEANPELTTSELEIRALSARTVQAGLRPNPEITTGSENFLAMGGSGLFHYSENLLQLSQRLELGGKRARRVRAGQKEMAAAGRMLDLKKADLVAEASQAFAEVLAGQERLANQRELSRLAEQTNSIVIDRVTAGKVSPVEQTRAKVALASARLEEEKQLEALAAAKDRLATLWGGIGQDISEAQGRFEIPAAPSGLDHPCLEETPELKLADAAVDFHRAELALEQSLRKPDLTVSAGFQRLTLEEQNAWVASITLPIPIFDRRQGAIAEARIRIDKSLAEKKAAEWHLRAALSRARHDYDIALLEANTLTQDALPASKDALAAVEEGYRFGKFEFLDVLDAQRTYAELQRRHIEAVVSGLSAAIEIERLGRCGRPVGVVKE